MPTLHLFNPENDLALAADEPNYTPPARALQLARAGALLPAWWAGEGDLIMAPDELNDTLAALKGRFGLKGEIAPGGVADVGGCSPWGWSRYAATLFSRAGVRADILPGRECLDSWRCLSGRRTAALLNSRIAELMPGRIGGELQSLVTDDCGRALTMIEGAGMNCYVKSPWSSSGRGVFCTLNMPVATVRKQIEGLLRRQGYVTVELALDKKLDFAALFECSGGRVTFSGWSVFATYDRCAYLGNYVASQGLLRQMIDISFDGTVDMDEVIVALTTALTEIVAPSYNGPLGVDMMVYRSRDGVCLPAPCIEMNLRRTMGMVAMAVADRLQLDGVWVYAVSPTNVTSHSSSDVIDILPPDNGFSFRLTRQKDFRM